MDPEPVPGELGRACHMGSRCFTVRRYTPAMTTHPHAAEIAAYLDGVPSALEASPRQRPRPATLRHEVTRTGPTSVILRSVGRSVTTDRAIDFAAPGAVAVDAWLDALVRMTPNVPRDAPKLGPWTGPEASPGGFTGA